MFNVRFISLPRICLALIFLLSVSCVELTAQPLWITDMPRFRADMPDHLIASGIGNSESTARITALGELSNMFGVSVQHVLQLQDTYRSVEVNGIANSTHNEYFGSNTNIASSIDSLIGAEIYDSWTDGRGNFYALAVLNKITAAQAYSERIRINQNIIDNLVNMNNTERYTFDGYRRYYRAAELTDINDSYREMLTVIDAPVQGTRSGNNFRLEAQEIAAAIPIDIRVTRDDSNRRIQGAFAKVFTDLGFRTGGAGSRYALVVDISLEPSPQQVPNILFSEMKLSANLVDTSSGVVLLPFTPPPLREGHRTQTGADNRAFSIAAQKIADEYPKLLSEYLAQLSAKR